MTEMSSESSISDLEREKLSRCVELAEEALLAGGEPFGSLITDASGTTLFEDRNRTESGDATLHPEFAIARWAAENLTPEERAVAITYTSGEHCAMCSAAHAWVGLGPIIYATSGAQLRGWREEWGVAGKLRIAPLAIRDVAPSVEARGPIPEFADRVRALHARLLGVNS